MDDLTLLQFFVAGEISLEANRNFKVEPAHDQRQLFCRDGTLLATAHDQAFPPYIALRLGSRYTPALHQTLIDHYFVPVTGILTDGFACYEYHPVPKNYVIYCEPARHLWKRWWQDRKHFKKTLDSEDLQILARNKWQAIQNIVLNRSTLYITADGYEAMHHGDETIVWLGQEESEATMLWADPSQSQSSGRIPEKTAAQPVPRDSGGQASPDPPSDLSPAKSEHPTTPGRLPAQEKQLTYLLPRSALQYRDGYLQIHTPFGKITLAGTGLKCLSCQHPCSTCNHFQPRQQEQESSISRGVVYVNPEKVNLDKVNLDKASLDRTLTHQR